METLSESMDLSKLDIEYDRQSDVFYFRLSAVHDWVAEDFNGEFFVLRDVETGNVVGFLVEDFEKVFLRKHPELENAWREGRAPWRRWSRELQEGVDRLFVGFFTRQASSQLRLLLQNG